MDMDCASDLHWMTFEPRSSIEKIIKDKHFVDKTLYCQSLIEENARCYLLRPPKFGKTFLLDLIDAICTDESRKEIFKNSLIGKSDLYDWKKYQVFRFDFASLDTSTVQNFEHSLTLQLIKNCLKYHIEYKLSDNSNDLIKEMMQSKNGVVEGYDYKVVVLIDNYDTPFYNSLRSGKEIDITKSMKKFYSSLSKYIKNKTQLVFLTGATDIYMKKLFHKSTNIFSNISLDEHVNAICGFTETEVVQVFSDQFNDVSRYTRMSTDEQLLTLKNDCGGYKFCKFGEQFIYNPYAFMMGLFNKYSVSWNAYDPMHFVNVVVSDVNHLVLATKDPLFIDSCKNLYSLTLDDKYMPILFKSFLVQNGLLTIEQYKSVTKSFDLKIPNNEAKRVLQDYLRYLFSYSGLMDKNDVLKNILTRNNDVSIIDCFNLNLLKWPYADSKQEPKPREIYIVDIIQQIYNLSVELKRDGMEPTRKELIINLFKCMFFLQLKRILNLK